MVEILRSCPMALVVFFVCGFSSAIKADEEKNKYENAVVRIYSIHRDFQGLGAGFFINSEGVIMTALHVIQNAKSIEVYGNQGEYKNPKLMAFDRSRDLAILKVDIAGKKSQPYLKIGSVPENLTLKKGTAIGHPDGKMYFKVEVSFTKDAPIESQKFLGEGQRQIFQTKDVRIIPIDATVNGGMSGGPLLVDGIAIGVIDGSQAAAGRTFGWAIPTSIANMSNVLNKRDWIIENFPSQQLVIENRLKDSMHAFVLNAEQIEKIKYFNDFKTELSDNIDDVIFMLKSSNFRIATLERDIKKGVDVADKIFDETRKCDEITLKHISVLKKIIKSEEIFDLDFDDMNFSPNQIDKFQKLIDYDKSILTQKKQQLILLGAARDTARDKLFDVAKLFTTTIDGGGFPTVDEGSAVLNKMKIYHKSTMDFCEFDLEYSSLMNKMATELQKLNVFTPKD